MKNKLMIITCILISLVIVLLSFGEIIRDYMPNLLEYNTIKKQCPGEYEICTKFKSKEDLDYYIKNENPSKKFDAITLASYVVETSNNFGILVFLSPLTMILLVVFKIHDEISSGYIENILTRVSYKQLMKIYISIALKAALLIPFLYIFIFLISCIITRFNFMSISETMLLSPGVDTFKYNHFIIYSIWLLSTQYLLHFSYALIGLLASFVSKSKIISVALGYIFFVIICILYLIFGAFVMRNLFGFYYNETNYFNLIGQYWFFNDIVNPWISYFIVISVICLISILIYIYAGKKEKVIELYEKQST